MVMQKKKKKKKRTSVKHKQKLVLMYYRRAGKCDDVVVELMVWLCHTYVHMYVHANCDAQVLIGTLTAGILFGVECERYVHMYESKTSIIFSFIT